MAIHYWMIVFKYLLLSGMAISTIFHTLSMTILLLGIWLLFYGWRIAFYPDLVWLEETECLQGSKVILKRTSQWDQTRHSRAACYSFAGVFSITFGLWLLIV